MIKNSYIVKTSLNINEKNHLLNILINHGCKNIYLHHAIYINSEKFVFILPDNYESSSPIFIAAYNKANGELHFFSLDDEGISLFNYILFKSNNLLDIGKGIQYLGTDAISFKKLVNNNTNLLSRTIEINEYFVYTLCKDDFLKNNDYFQKSILNDSELKFNFATRKSDIYKLINLQKGYLYEEMQYPNQILSEKFIFLNLLKILKLYRLFYLEKDQIALAKCEWNAFSDKIFQLGGVYVDPKLRCKGLAFTMLYKMLYHSFINLEKNEASLFVRMSNLNAQKLYEKLNFKRYKTNLIWAIFKIN